jgi:predicted nucleic acid-binding Zn ribbon protein
MKRNFESKSLKNVIGNIIDSSNKLNSGLNNIKVQNLWREVMGNNVNSYTNEIVLKKNTLYVNLSSSVLRQELSFGKQKIIDLLNKELGKTVIKKIVLR